jgi:HD-like signal output (HDOD) protein
MKVACPKCHSKIDIPDSRLKESGFSITFNCLSCGNIVNLNIKSRTGKPVKETAKDKKKQSTEDKPPAGAAELKQEVLSSVKDLPPMPQVAEKARKLVADPGSSFSDLAKIIETDQAIVARVLKMANSAFYGAVGKIASAQQASVVLGLKTLNELLSLACASELLNKSLKGYGLKPDQMWKHSLAVASGSRLIAENVFPSKADGVFSAGLIHDVGKLILNPYIFERKKIFDKALKKNMKSWFAAEREVLGFDHSEIGSAVCQMWRIPRETTTSIRYHHEPSLSPEKDLAYVICAADMIAISIAEGCKPEDAAKAMDKEVLKFLGLKKADIVKIAEEVKDYTDKIVAE